MQPREAAGPVFMNPITNKIPGYIRTKEDLESS